MNDCILMKFIVSFKEEFKKKVNALKCSLHLLVISRILKKDRECFRINLLRINLLHAIRNYYIEKLNQLNLC